MANQISKSSILAFLNERFESAQISSNYDNQYTEFNKGKAWILENLINHIEKGRFDYSDELEVSAQMYTNNKKFNENLKKYNVYPNGAMIDKSITSNY